MAGATLFPVKKLLALTPDQAERIASYRFDNRIPSEAEAVRQLIELGLESTTKAKPKKPVRDSTRLTTDERRSR